MEAIFKLFPEPTTTPPVFESYHFIVPKSVAAVKTIAPVPHLSTVVNGTVTKGCGFTTTVSLAVLTQPFTSVPVTVYNSVEVGTKDTPFEMPLSQLYVCAPTPDKVTASLEQTEVFVALTVIIGKGFTVMLAVKVAPAHPLFKIELTV
jgi:hypothetical protein